MFDHASIRAVETLFKLDQRQLSSSEGLPELIDLTLPGEWQKLFERYMPENSAAGAPWRRSVVVLQSLDAKTCVIEHHYVCLDHRSEISAFYSQLDEPVMRSSARLHFFATKLDSDDLMSLSDTVEYLGYIVLRSVGMPPIVRAMLKPPFSLQTCESEAIIAASEETVNFFGQRLRITGVPFMQQDTRYATCAHAAAWMVFYTAFRRGISERRLISEVVSSSGVGAPMRPVISDGLRVQEVLALFQTNGLSAAHHRLHPATQLGLCEIQGSDLAQGERFSNAHDVYRQALAHVDAAVSKAGSSDLDVNSKLDPSVRARQFVREIAVLINQMQASELVENTQELLADYTSLKQLLPPLVDALTIDFVRPYLQSGFPIYCHTENHATILCGLLTEEMGKKVEYVFHDDVYGPYLVTDSIAQAHHEDFDVQSATQVGRDAALLPVASLLTKRAENHSGTSRHVLSLVVPTPRRALLPPMSAVRAGSRFLAAVSLTGLEALKLEGVMSEETDEPVLGMPGPRSVLMMGVDFKRSRRTELNGIEAARNAYSSVHLAEWVIVVEYSDEAGRVRTELVFDASSGDYEPRLQLMRVDGELRARAPGACYGSWSTSDAGDGLPLPVEVPLHVGKVA